MPRPRKTSKASFPENTLIIDNGGYTIKAGYAPSTLSSLSDSIDLSACHTIPNCLAKLPSSKTTFVGAQLSQCRDFAEMVFRRPVQRGQLVNWEAEREIWLTSFFDTESGGGGGGGGANSGLVLACENPQETNLILTEAPNSLNILQSNADQVVFEEFEFASYRRVPGPLLGAYCDVAGLFGDVKAKGKPVQDAAVQQGEGEKEAASEAGSVTTLGRGLATSECVLVVDCGYSHTTVTPIYQGRPIQQAVRRLEIAGKVLTNHLKETLSLRQLDLTHEFHIVNEMKEDLCFVTMDLRNDLEKTWKQGPRYEPKQQQENARSDSPEHNGGEDGMEIDTETTPGNNGSLSEAVPLSDDPYAKGIVLDYVMPDYTTRFRGEARPHDLSSSKLQSKLKQLGGASDTVVTIGNERFATPELLFHPSDIGMQQAGLAELIMQSIRAVPPGLWSALLGNVLVVGGTTKMPGLVDRLYAELRPLVPVEVMVRVKQAADPEKAIWEGGARLAARARDQGLLKDLFVTRQEYQENGEHWLMRQFAVERPLPW